MFDTTAKYSLAVHVVLCPVANEGKGPVVCVHPYKHNVKHDYVLSYIWYLKLTCGQLLSCQLLFEGILYFDLQLMLFTSPFKALLSSLFQHSIITGETSRMYEANVDDVGYRLVAVYTPVREDGVEGQPVSASTDPISVGMNFFRLFNMGMLLVHCFSVY